LSAPEIAEILARLAAIDRSSRREPWTLRFLTLIAERPGVRAPDLAASVGWETPAFKRSVRKLKELGLTESLEVGYRLSPRGRAIVAAAEDAVH
jgi:DNA-binding IclR family transcriptional regulator